MHPLLALGGWLLAVMIAVGAWIYVWLVERSWKRLAERFAASEARADTEERRATFWRTAALGEHEAQAQAHKRTRELRWR
jgi:hypothetical protein